MRADSPYRVLRFLIPGCFVVGGAMELFMIKVPIGGQTFYDVAKRKKAEQILEAQELQRKRDAESVDRKRRLQEKYAGLNLQGEGESS